MEVLIHSGCCNRMHRPGGLQTNINLSLTSSGSRKPTIKTLEDSVSGRSSLPGSQTVVFLLKLSRDGRDERPLWAPIPCMRAPPSDLITSQRPLILAHLGWVSKIGI